MTTYQLVAGAWLGGWAWAPVTRRLRDFGHDVYPVTLTGLGERAHLAGPDVDLDTHITDVVNTLEYDDLHEVVLVGHSYAGMVVTGAAGGWRLPMPSWAELQQGGASLDGLGDTERARMRARATDQPFGTYTQPLRLTDPAREALPKLLVSNSFPLDQVRQLIAGGHPWFKELAGPEWRLLELPTGHWAMFSRPGDLADLLASDQAQPPRRAGEGGDGRQLPL